MHRLACISDLEGQTSDITLHPPIVTGANCVSLCYYKCHRGRNRSCCLTRDTRTDNTLSCSDIKIQNANTG